MGVDVGAGVGVCVGVVMGVGVGKRVAVGVEVGAGLDEGGGNTAAGLAEGVVPFSISRCSTGGDRAGAPNEGEGDATVLAAAGLACSVGFGVALTPDAVFTAGGWDKANLAG